MLNIIFSLNQKLNAFSNEKLEFFSLHNKKFDEFPESVIKRAEENFVERSSLYFVIWQRMQVLYISWQIKKQ